MGGVNVIVFPSQLESLLSDMSKIRTKTASSFVSLLVTLEAKIICGIFQYRGLYVVA